MTPSHRRRAGVCMHITSLPGPHGVGTIGAPARWFVDQMVRMGLTLWQVLPTGPTGYGDSPYQLLSVFAGNPMLIDLPTLRDEGLLSDAELAQLPAGAPNEVQFGELIDARGKLLQRAAQRFLEHAGPERVAAFDAFIAEHETLWLGDYAVYRVIKDAHQKAPWYDWSEPLARGDRAACDAVRRATPNAVQHQKIVQFLFFEQWQALRQYAARKGVKLMGDAPIYVAMDSADTWSRPDLFQLNDRSRPTAVGGVPPDYFSADGQLWGNPLYDWPSHVDNGFDWWIARVRHCAMLTDLVRIDHFRGFESYWSIPPDESTARNGQWIEAPGYQLFDALSRAFESLPIIAEDLGVITDEVNALRQHYALPGMAVLQFLLDEEHFHPDHIAEDRVCYTGTHDNDTTVSWFAGDAEGAANNDPLRQRVLALTGGDADNVHIDLIRMAFNSRARYAIAPMQDFLGLPTYARFNTPGTTNGNWRWRLTTDQIDQALVEQVSQLVRDSGRGDHH
ncbi:MAG: 4-alpha-glucanotransferase [Gammaproteobacteria bacterium]